MEKQSGSNHIPNQVYEEDGYLHILLDPQELAFKIVEIINDRSNALHISYNRISGLIGMSKAYITNLIREQRIPELETMFRISQVLDFKYYEITQHNPFIFINDPRKEYTEDPNYEGMNADDINEYKKASQEVDSRYAEFTNSKWYKDHCKREQYSYTINLEKEFDTCAIIENKMRDSHMILGSIALYTKGGFVTDGIYCCSIKGAPKVIRRIYEKDGKYLITNDSQYKVPEPELYNQEEVTVLGKVVWTITPVNKKEGTK